MDRRDFLTRAAALVAAPALPASALASAPAAAPAALQPNLYTWSTAIARTHGRVSADMLKRMLHVDADKAASLFDRLLANNIVGPSDAFGVARARAIIPAPTGIAGTASDPVTKVFEKKVDVPRLSDVLDHEEPSQNSRTTEEGLPETEGHTATRTEGD